MNSHAAVVTHICAASSLVWSHARAHHGNRASLGNGLLHHEGDRSSLRNPLRDGESDCEKMNEKCMIARPDPGACDQTGVPIHFHSSTTSGSASLMSLRILPRVSPRQSPSSAILFEMSSDAGWPWLAPECFMFSSWKFQIYCILHIALPFARFAAMPQRNTVIVQA